MSDDVHFGMEGDVEALGDVAADGFAEGDDVGAGGTATIDEN